jgi:hypothetical protein
MWHPGLYSEDGAYTNMKPWLHEGAALVARGRSPGCTRAQPWLHEGGTLVAGLYYQTIPETGGKEKNRFTSEQ